MTLGKADFYDVAALIERLTGGVKHSDRPVTFLFGSPLTAPAKQGEPGVPNVAGIIDIIRSEFSGSQAQAFDDAVKSTSNPYQAAFSFLIGRRGQQAANNVIKKAVWQARRPTFSTENLADYQVGSSTSDDTCRAADSEVGRWFLTPGVRALGHLMVEQKAFFGHSVLTTNFDPLIGVAIGAAGGNSFRTILHRDGDVGQTEGDGSHVIHLHGYWYGADTLHTPRQLNQERPRLRASLANLIRDRILVVCGYGGWDDVFTQTLMQLVLDDHAFPEIIWTFKEDEPVPPTALLERLTPGMDRGRVSLYSGIDCQQFLPELLQAWRGESGQPLHEPSPPLDMSEYSPPEPTQELNGSQKERVRFHFFGSEQDRPPFLDHYVGRVEEIDRLRADASDVVFVTGLGGQGKSALVGNYFSSNEVIQKFDYRIWRDCREEGDRFESQIVSLVEGLGCGRVSAEELSKQSIEDLSELFLDLSRDQNMLIVFDNIDHYIDLEHGVLTGAPRKFVDRVIGKLRDCRVVFTCRPVIDAAASRVLSMRIDGLDVAATQELFRLRGADASLESIRSAHEFTRGHAFWLDLLAAQVARREPAVDLEDLLDSLSGGGGEIPRSTLNSIWDTLKDREQRVLRTLAETVKPTTQLQLSEYLRRSMNFNHVVKSVRALRAVNLIVFKIQDDGEEILDLHPLIRTYIRQTFTKSDRGGFIEDILRVYAMFFRQYAPSLSVKPTYKILQNWIEGAELYVAAGNYEEAFERLQEASSALRRSEAPGEFVRVSGALFSQINWSEWEKYKSFDSVFDAHFEMMSQLGRLEECADLMECYKSTIDGKGARYIQYCNLNAYMNWVNGNHLAAITWATEGVELKSKSGVDTKYDAAHNLALAQRDYGLVDEALEYFLQDRSLDEILDPKELNENRGGPYYGNIGRCLHFMGQLENALICYSKSALCLDDLAEADSATNRGYIRQWIGETLIGLGHPDVGIACLEAAVEKWKTLSPPKAEKLRHNIASIMREFPHVATDRLRAERIYLDWLKSYRARVHPR